ncbi:PD-(D/E)XK nuclease family protein [Brevibacterium sp. 91QC2O2]|uniref:RecB family exonuclease n=1 Tax=Brevibacterium TaxID=1696 RepID=UPI00211BD800|nr:MULTISPECIES: PD-(D/E)XK nuclease family protein [unclassified Brevibacterium]MCQ9366794.1 PD-(D/E)XK nuclease family protein [Brevibacterium sp. 91QC2O2]MCQ9383944.1 PD-(D/E)XK nuclease family protein [Brevibacterium sp. 68QC2CO]
MAELNALSPSRANDFLQCPLKFRFRTVDRLPEPPSAAAFKGTLVHAVLEHLYDLPAPERTLDAARGLIVPRFDDLARDKEDVAELFPDEVARDRLFDESAQLLRSYFALELPDRLEPAEREKFVSVTLDNGLKLRGFIDRIDVAPGGQIRLVDYKTGKQPKPQYSREAEFQMRFYALLRYRTDGVLVHTLQLMYLGSRSIKAMRPVLADVERTEHQILGLWEDISRSAETGVWRTRTSPLCGWCHFKPLCPAWGNEAPAAPEITAIAGR